MYSEQKRLDKKEERLYSKLESLDIEQERLDVSGVEAEHQAGKAGQ